MSHSTLCVLTDLSFRRCCSCNCWRSTSFLLWSQISAQQSKCRRPISTCHGSSSSCLRTTWRFRLSQFNAAVSHVTRDEQAHVWHLNRPSSHHRRFWKSYWTVCSASVPRCLSTAWLSTAYDPSATLWMARLSRAGHLWTSSNTTWS